MSQTRRNFLKTMAVSTAGLVIVPSKVVSGLGYKAPSDRMNIVGIGIGGKGHTNIMGMKTENIIGLCDVDWRYAENCFKNFPDAG
ncbi:MAG: twin-arginine translocation signal domain-containing protein, partial [Tannerella sp.]|nr:twin-arginine translocation signal domain-containing protein [Tannerella sp.]